MLDRAKFTETLKSVAEIIRTAPEPMTEEEILGYFSDMNLDEEQKGLVFTYLTTPHEEEMQISQKEIEIQDAEVENEEEISEVSPILQMYLDEIKDIAPLSSEEENQLYERLILGEEEVIPRIAECWLERVLGLAKQHKKLPIVIEDIIQEGNMGLFLALQELKGSKKKMDYCSFLSDSIEKSMWEFIVESGVKEEGGNSIVGKMSLVQEAKKILEEEKERGVTVQELSDYTKMPEEELQGVLDLIEKANTK